MKHFLQGLMLITFIMASNIGLCQWTQPNAQGNINNTNVGSVILNGTLDQRNFNPNGGPLDPNGGNTAQVNANFGGLIFHSAVNTTSVMNMFWGQNFDYHNNDDIRYRINGPAAQQQMVNGSIYFYTAPSGIGGQRITTFAFQPKISIANNGGFAIGNTYAIANVSAQGTLLVENNIGLGTQTPSAQLHTTGTVRLQGLTTGGTPNNLVSIDANGQLWRSALTTGGVQNLCTNANFITKSANGGSFSCSQIFDDGISVGINQTTNFNYTGLTVVGTTTPPANGTARLAVNGVTMSLAYFATSDETMKKNIQNIPNALEKIKALQGKLYEWKTDQYRNNGMDENRQIGFIAQDVAKILPEVVAKKEDGTYAVNYDGIIPVLSEGIKEQQTVIEELKNEIVQLKNDINNLKSVSENKVKNNYITIAPNPFSQTTQIKYKLPTNVANATCFLYDLQGKIIKQIKVPLGSSSGTLTLTKENLSSGVYFVSISANNAELQTEKIIIAN